MMIIGWILHVFSSQRGGFWIYPTLYPISRLNSLKKTLPDYSIQQSDCAYYHTSTTSNKECWIEPEWGQWPDFKTTNQILTNLLWTAKRKRKNCLEFNQIVTHPMGLHWSDNKSAFCVMNELGEEVEKIKIITTDDIKLILINRKCLDEMLYLGKWALVRYFTFVRYLSDNWSRQSIKKYIVNSQKYTGTKFKLITSYSQSIDFFEFKGAIINLLKTSKDDLHEDKKRYESFIVYDWKNNKNTFLAIL